MTMQFSRQTLYKAAAILITLVSVGFVIQAGARHFSDIPKVSWNATSGAVAGLSISLVVLNTFLGGTIWRLLLLDAGTLVSFRRTLIVFSIAQLGKYLPGNVGQHIGRVVLAREIGIPVPVTVSTLVLEMLWAAGIGAGLALLSVTLFFDRQNLGTQLPLGPVQLGLVAAALLLLPWLGIAFLNKFLPRLAQRLAKDGTIKTPTLRTAVAVAVLFLLCFLAMGLILKLQAQWLFGVSQGGVLELTCLFALAWLAGYIIPGAPGGLGVREAMMVLLLSPILGTGVAVGLGLTLRITTTVGDAIASLFGIVGRRLLPSS